ncbi:hypothetical protein QFZ53_000611 [Microbacterium natoriense]|uniref:Transcriptional regulator n=2 Tax=Microbacterium TaxID=33882 RepID=A0AAW8EU97_9MICO|nr:hypothetical protein [Microbacterium natoriense]MDQ0646415.1 hypothetical protein [Microbacterium natoriense]
MPLVEALTSWGGRYAAHQRRELARTADEPELLDELEATGAP